MKTLKSSYDPLGARPGDPLARWIAEAEEAERGRQEFRQGLKDAERRDVEAARANRAWGELEQRLAVLETAHVELKDAFCEGMRAIRETIDLVVDRVVELPHKQLDRIDGLQAEITKLSAALVELREQRAKEFQFAREKQQQGGAEELPNPLQSRRDLN